MAQEQSKALTAVDTTQDCPECGFRVEAMTVIQDALLRHGGYGASQRRVYRFCGRCPWSIMFFEGEERPPR